MTAQHHNSSLFFCETRIEPKKAVGIDEQLQKRYNLLSLKIKGEETTKKQLVEKIKISEGAGGRRMELIQERKNLYLETFKEFINEENILKQLYMPLANELEGAKGALSKLKVAVYRRVNISDWADRGESFIDLRTAEKLRGIGKLQQEAERYLLQAWSKGTPEQIAAAIEEFRHEFSSDLMESISKRLTIE